MSFPISIDFIFFVPKSQPNDFWEKMINFALSNFNFNHFMNREISNEMLIKALVFVYKELEKSKGNVMTDGLALDKLLDKSKNINI
jgi:hypothetical protein